MFLASQPRTVSRFAPPLEPDLDAETIGAAAFILGLRARGIRDLAVLGAMERVPRETFAPGRFADLARSDVSLPLPCGQTMTAPGAVAVMLVALGLGPGQRALEIGTGSGYVTALLARLCGNVHTIERYGCLADAAAARLTVAGITDGIGMTIGDGLAPPADEGRYDRILVNGAVRTLPAAVTSLLAPGGRLIGAVAFDGLPRLVRVERAADGHLTHVFGPTLRISALTPGRAASL